MQPQRHLTWDACYNVRDLGGLPTVDGGETKWRAIVRSDILSRLTEQGRAALLDYGIRTVIDLRSPEQVAQEPSVFTTDTAAAAGITYLNLPVEEYYPHVGALISQAQSRAEVYCITIDHYSRNTANILRAIAHAQPGGVVIHCHAGKDRTGVVAALLLGLAGVADDLIAEDYAESQKRLWPLYEEIIKKVGGEDKADFWLKPTATADMMHTLLAHITTRYGGIPDYLYWAGLSGGELVLLQQRLQG
jgi:protein tyrosine/serine phosphatase